MLQAEEPGHSNLSCPSEGETGYANLNCAATEDACGCAPLHGWSNSTGVGCCKLGSVTSPQEETACQGIHDGRLSGTVGAQERNRATRRYLERQVDGEYAVPCGLKVR